jgi:hypothetical protein
MTSRSATCGISLSRHNVADRYNTQLYALQTRNAHHAASKKPQGIAPNECLTFLSAGSGVSPLIQNRHDYPSTAAGNGLLARSESTNGGLGRQHPEPTLDGASDSRRLGDMATYSPEQIISRASAAGRAAYAAVIRAGRAVSVAESAYNRAYIRTIPPCWAALLPPPRPPKLDSEEWIRGGRRYAT